MSLVFTESDQIISFIANIAPFVCGLFFSISMLPDIFFYLGLVFPFTWALNISDVLSFNHQWFFQWKSNFVNFNSFCDCWQLCVGFLMKKAKREGLSKFWNIFKIHRETSLRRIAVFYCFCIKTKKMKHIILNKSQFQQSM